MIAELSIHPIGEGTSVGSYVKAAIESLAKLDGLKYSVTPMSTILEAEDIQTILEAVKVAHVAVKEMGARRISSLLRIDQRLDKRRTMQDKVWSVLR